MFDGPRIFAFLADRLSKGERTCLVTVTDVTGASVRNPGAHLAVAADGSFTGSLSGGCIEKAVVAEALRAIANGEPHRIAYGAGTPIIDIRLPCGGRVDLLFTPMQELHLVDDLRKRLALREPAVLALPTGHGKSWISGEGKTGWSGDHFLVRHHPPLRLVIAGHGGTIEALVRLAQPLQIFCEVLTPDVDVAAALEGQDVQVQILTQLGVSISGSLDHWTAMAFFFHDHDWETRLMVEATRSDAFFVGAMGSMVTHSHRLESLRRAGLGEEECAQIVAPIGLVPSSRDPETLALSTLAQIVDSYNAVIGAQFSS